MSMEFLSISKTGCATVVRSTREAKGMLSYPIIETWAGTEPLRRAVQALLCACRSLFRRLASSPCLFRSCTVLTHIGQEPPGRPWVNSRVSLSTLKPELTQERVMVYVTPIIFGS
jgi:hypothetical protein